MLGLTINGGFAEYMKADARVVSKIPETIPWDQAAPLVSIAPIYPHGFS